MKLVADHYKQTYRDRLKLDLMPAEVASVLLDIAVNVGNSAPGFMLQKVLNMLNKNGKLYNEIIIDGRISEETIAALKECISVYGEKLIVRMLILMKAKRFIEILNSDRTRKDCLEWLRGAELPAEVHPHEIRYPDG
jgi:lysozyme family protein